MAIEALKESREIRVGFAEESTFKTPIADSGTFVQLATEPVSINPDYKLHAIPGQHGNRNKAHFEFVTSTKGSMPMFTIKGPASVYNIDQIAYAFFQLVSEGATTPFTKTFTPFTTQPIFSANAGHFLTWVKAFPAAGTSQKMTSCICSRFKLSLDREDNDGLLMFEADFVSPITWNKASTAYADATFEIALDGPGGSDAESTMYGYKHFNDLTRFTVDFNGTASPLDDKVALKGFEFEYTQVVEGINPASGSWEDLGLHSRDGKMIIKILKDSKAEKTYENIESNSQIITTMGFGAAGSAVNLESELIVYSDIDPDGVAVDEDGLIAATITSTVTQENTLTTAPVTFRVANAIDRTW